MTLGERLTELRKKKNLSQEDVAEKLNVTRQTVSKWELDQSTPDFDKVIPICKLYNITSEELLTGRKADTNNDDIEYSLMTDEEIKKKTAIAISISVGLFILSVIWIIIGGLFMRILSYVKTGMIEPYVFNWQNPQNGNGPVWFLIALLYAKIITGCMVKSKLPEFVLFVCSIAIGYIGATYQMPLLMDEGMAALPLYYTGKYLFPYLGDIIKKWWVNIIGICVWGAFMTTQLYYNIGPVHGLYNPYYLLAILGAMFVFIPFMTLSKMLVNIKPLIALGEMTLEVMLIHTFICHVTAVLLNRLFVVGSGIWICSFLFFYVVIVFLSYYVSIFLKKYIPVLF